MKTALVIAAVAGLAYVAYRFVKGAAAPAGVAAPVTIPRIRNAIQYASSTGAMFTVGGA